MTYTDSPERDYDNNIAKLEKREQRIQEIKKDMLDTNGECDPYTHDHILEALSNSDSMWLTAQIIVAKNTPENPVSKNHVVLAIQDVVEKYWDDVADTLAEREYDKWGV